MCTGWQLAVIILEIISIMISSYVLYYTTVHIHKHYKRIENFQGDYDSKK